MFVLFLLAGFRAVNVLALQADRLQLVRLEELPQRLRLLVRRAVFHHTLHRSPRLEGGMDAKNILASIPRSSRSSTKRVMARNHAMYEQAQGPRKFFEQDELQPIHLQSKSIVISNWGSVAPAERGRSNGPRRHIAVLQFATAALCLNCTDAPGNGSGTE